MRDNRGFIILAVIFALCFIVLSMTSVHAAWNVGGDDLSNELKAYWAFNDSGSPILDSFKGEYNISFLDGNPATTGQSGLISTSWLLNGDVEYQAPSIVGLNVVNITINIWTNTAGGMSPAGHLFDFNGGGSGMNINVDNNVHGYFYGCGGTDQDTGVNIADNTWHMITYTQDDNNRMIYVDGILKVNQSCTTPSATQLLVGGDGGSFEFYNGKIDETSFWNRVLNETVIAALYNGGSGFSYTNSTGGASSSLLVNLNSPTDSKLFQTPTNLQSIEFQATIIPTLLNLTNATLNIYQGGTLNSTLTNILSGNVSTTASFSQNFSLGNYTWNIEACGVDSMSSILCTTSSNRTFSLVHNPSVYWTAIFPDAYWKFNENGLQNASDSSGFGNTLYWVNPNPSIYNIGKINNALDSKRNASDGYTIMSGSAGGHLNFGTGNFTVAVWIKQNLTDDNDLLIHGNTGAGGWIVSTRHITGGEAISFSNVLTSPTVLDDNIWHRIIYERDNGTLRMYVDGINVGNTSFLTNLNGNENLTLSSPNGIAGIGDFWIDDLQIYKGYAFTPAQAARDYTRGNLGLEADTYLNMKSFSYNPSAFIGSSENYGINLSIDSAHYSSASANLIYNGTVYTGMQSGVGDTVSFSANIPSIPLTLSPNYTFYWQVTLTNSTSTLQENSTILTQNILTSTPISVSSSCGADLFPSLLFTFANETTSLPMNNSATYNFQYGFTNSTAFVVNGTFTNTAEFSICMNQSQPYYNVGNGEIDYGQAGYVARRFYIFSGTRLTNSTINNTLYDLDLIDGTPFSFNVKSVNLDALSGDFISLLRWYPDQNQYKLVEMGKTDDAGNTILTPKTLDVDYRISVFNPDGTLQQMYNPVRFICTTNPCSYNLLVNNAGSDFTSIFGVESNLTFDPNTKVFTYIWNDVSQKTRTMNLTVYQDVPDSDSVVICSQTGTGFIGLLTCDTTGYDGVLRAVVQRTASPPVTIAQLIVNIGRTIVSIGQGAFGLFLSFLIFLTLSLIGIFNPVVAIIMGVVGLIPAMAIGSITFSVAIGFAVIAGVIIHFMTTPR